MDPVPGYLWRDQMSASTVKENPVQRDVIATVRFLKDSPDFIEKLSKDNLEAKFDSLPTPVQTVIGNLGGEDWDIVVGVLDRAGLDGKQVGESLRPLLEGFKPLASKVSAQM